jgi:hypothetical protein
MVLFPNLFWVIERGSKMMVKMMASFRQGRGSPRASSPTSEAELSKLLQFIALSFLNIPAGRNDISTDTNISVSPDDWDGLCVG